jgi:hypothetical protein
MTGKFPTNESMEELIRTDNIDSDKIDIVCLRVVSGSIVYHWHYPVDGGWERMDHIV